MVFFRRFLRTLSCGRRPASRESDSHPALAGLADGQSVNVALGPDKYLVVGELKALCAKLTPLLKKDKGNGRAWVACAELKNAEPNAGHVVFRPRKFPETNMASPTA